jgi:hypothetical protein
MSAFATSLNLPAAVAAGINRSLVPALFDLQ